MSLLQGVPERTHRRKQHARTAEFVAWANAHELTNLDMRRLLVLLAENADEDGHGSDLSNVALVQYATTAAMQQDAVDYLQVLNYAGIVALDQARASWAREYALWLGLARSAEDVAAAWSAAYRDGYIQILGRQANPDLLAADANARRELERQRHEYNRQYRPKPCRVCGGRTANRGNTYIMQVGGHVKIGVSRSPADRFRQYAKKGAIRGVICPDDLDLRVAPVLLHVFDTDIEHDLHERWRAYHAAGEWFVYQGELREWIVATAGTSDPGPEMIGAQA